MSNGTREKQALGVFLILIVLSTFGIAWYMVAGHSWNVAASSIDEKVGQMEGYTSIVYAGTLPVQADARMLDSQNGSDAQLEEGVGRKGRRGCFGIWERLRFLRFPRYGCVVHLF